jgi:hypothetical protein
MSRVILDECLPRRLGRLLAGHQVMTVPQAGLAGLKNGKLLAAIKGRFEVFVTIDGNLEYQQNLTGLDFAVVVIHARSNRFADLEPLAEELLAAVVSTPAGSLASVFQR